MRFLISLFALLWTTSGALDLSREYQHGPFPFDENAEFWFTMDLDSRTALMAVKVKDASIVTAGANWIGMGVSEPTSGSMLGADVITAEFLEDETDNCKFTDRHVPFAAYPLIETVDDSRGAFPDPDDCQEDGSWELTRCERSEGDGEMVLEVSRNLDAHDKQDRDIVPGLNNIIYAYGSVFAHHGSRRSSQRLFLYSEDGDESLVGDGQEDLPNDVDGSVVIQATNYTIPDEKGTIYACTSQRIRLKKGERKMIIAAEPVLKATSVNKVHHLTVYLCASEEYASLLEKTTECTSDPDNGIDSPQANRQGKCSTFVYAYAKGLKRLVLPREAGILVDEKEYFLVMETHYDNPDRIKGEIDQSGVRVFLTDTMREHEAASLLMGESMLSLSGQTVKNKFEYEFTCPSECTSKFSEPINLYASFLHMHTTGQEIYNNRFDKNGTFIETLNKVNFWSDSFQQYVVYDPPKVIQPGDEMQVTCVYDTSKRPDTKFGSETKNEMCMEFVTYWPVQRDKTTGHRINLCSFVDEGDGELPGFTFCGDIGNLDFSVGKSILPVPNPKFEDKVGAPTDFGTKDVCMKPEVLPTNTPVSTPGGGTGVDTGTGDGGDETPATEDDGDETPATEDDGAACFPASGMVQTKSGPKRMEELTTGEEVAVGAGKFSEVFMFTHRDPMAYHTFVQLRVVRGEVLTLTRGHYLYINGALREAGSAKIGDAVDLEDGKAARILRVTLVRKRGLYNPQTVSGDIVVDGVRASTYTSAVEWKTGHALLAPVRWASGLFGVDASAVVVG